MGDWSKATIITCPPNVMSMLEIMALEDNTEVHIGYDSRDEFVVSCHNSYAGHAIVSGHAELLRDAVIKAFDAFRAWQEEGA